MPPSVTPLTALRGRFPPPVCGAVPSAHGPSGSANKHGSPPWPPPSLSTPRAASESGRAGLRPEGEFSGHPHLEDGACTQRRFHDRDHHYYSRPRCVMQMNPPFHHDSPGDASPLSRFTEVWTCQYPGPSKQGSSCTTSHSIRRVARFRAIGPSLRRGRWAD
ncbi:hypothetical protein LY76DRAFT_223771 [Colletotrichum caudatum]|nr:hypothetical protein LY76DRAFT_223771 [Colletotrichum caudatum]